MKVWYVPPACLPDALLYRQHQSIHGIINGIIIGKPRRGVTRYLRYGGFAFWVHYLSVEEMLRRGARHESFVDKLWDRIPAARRRFDYPLRPELARRDMALIQAKIADPRYRCQMNNASVPLAADGMKLIEQHRVLVATNRLPKDALVL